MPGHSCAGRISALGNVSDVRRLLMIELNKPRLNLDALSNIVKDTDDSALKEFVSSLLFVAKAESSSNSVVHAIARDVIVMKEKSLGNIDVRLPEKSVEDIIESVKRLSNQNEVLSAISTYYPEFFEFTSFDDLLLEFRRDSYAEGIRTTAMLGDHEMLPLANWLKRPILVVRKENKNSIEGKYYPDNIDKGSYRKEDYIVVQNQRNLHFVPFTLDSEIIVSDLVSGRVCKGKPGVRDYAGAGVNDCLLASIRAQHNGLEHNKVLREYLAEQVRCLDLSFFA
tara:strand:+ start:87 stop:932 length:846 start_codon:yes stop_codon:yes gene_type:complete